MHMKHCYDSKFGDVVSAFVRKYNQESKVCCTTICHVEQIDKDKFQFVRRMENVVSSKPLYERIVIDRSTNQLHGFTFETPQDEIYSEHFVYRLNAQGNVNYDMFLFRDPGLMRVLRFKMHTWGVQNLTKIIAASQLVKQKKEAAKQLIKEKKDSIKEKAVDKIVKAKDKSAELKNKAKNVVLKTDK